MKTTPQLPVQSVALALALTSTTLASGPYPPTDWPPTIDPAKIVHYLVVDEMFAPPNANWNPSLGILTGGDQATANVTVCDPELTFTGKKSTANPGYINVFDTAFEEWNTVPVIDILVQVYGDASVLNPANQSQARTWQARLGTTGSGVQTGNTVTLSSYSTNAYNNRWNWILFTGIVNKEWTNTIYEVGGRYVGSVPPGSGGNANYGGVNGGTIRFGAPSAQSFLNGVNIHAIAFGEEGAFGTAEDINQFEPQLVVTCDPVPDVNLVGIDFNAGVTNHLQVMNDGDQTVAFLPSVGPAGDLRKAVMPLGAFLNFGILDDYLGKPCNPNVTMKVCVDFYDDPAFAGQSVQFGPEAYATDPLGCNPPGIYPSSGLHTLEGTGQWIRKSWTVSGVNLLGVNTAPLTGGPRFICVGAPVAVSRFYLAALRTAGPLAGQDPLADCYADPLICAGLYGNYAELDLANGIVNGLDVGSNSGDQLYVVEEAGPAGDRRTAVRSLAPPEYNLNFSILDNALGPTAQGNVHLAITVTYYDDPALTGQGFRPRVYRREFAGAASLAFLDGTPQPNIVLQGTGQWRDAYWEIGNIHLSGVNQGPQAAARFLMENPSDTQGICISRVRYAVIRHCGPTAGQNLLADPVQLTATLDAGQVRLSWPYRAPQAQLQGAPTLGGPWNNVPGAPTVEGGDQSVVRLAPEGSSQFFRVTITPP